MYRYILATIIFFVGLKASMAQEFKFDINISSQMAQIVDPQVYNDMEANIKDFLNNRIWTRDNFEDYERIDINIQIVIIKELSETSFEGELTVQASRPVYGTTYETLIFNHVDREFVFSYDIGRPLIYADNVFSENLTHVFAFYCYLILGLDYDSFSPYGGDKYIQLAQEVVAAAPSGGAESQGWKSTDGNRSRFRIIENLISPRLRPFRKVFYDYHRLGLDMMHKDAEAGKAVIFECLEELQNLNKVEPNSAILQIFSSSKSQELVDIFFPMPSQEKQAVYKIMTSIDPSVAVRMADLRR